MVQSFERLFNTDRFNVKKRVAGDVTGNTDTAELEKIAQLISTEHLTNRHSWMTIFSACIRRLVAPARMS